VALPNLRNYAERFSDTAPSVTGSRNRYSAQITAGGLKLRESRIVADLLLAGIDDQSWTEKILFLQARSPETATRLGRLVRQRLETMDADLWKLVRDGSQIVATHATLAAIIKHSPLVGDFLDLILREQFRLFAPRLTKAIWEDYLSGCRARDPEMPKIHNELAAFSPYWTWPSTS